MNDGPAEHNAIEAFIAEYQMRKQAHAGSNGSRRFHAIPWLEAWDKDYASDWLVDGLWPMGKHLHIFAAAKTGKSLLQLWIAANLAYGRDPFTGASIVPRIVAYLDREMTEQDVIERLQDMGFEPSQLLNLHYYLYPTMAPLDTPLGGVELMSLVDEIDASVVMLDTLSRVVHGDENSNDTYRNFHLYTGSLLKARGISMARLDHEGKVLGTSRGASAKADDVDLIYQLGIVEGGLKLKKFAARVNSTRDEIFLTKEDEPLSFRTTGQTLWPAGVMEKAKQMDDMGLPLDVTKRDALDSFKRNDIPAGKATVLLAAIRYRKWKLPLV